MKKLEKSIAKSKNCSQTPTAKTVHTPKIVIGAEIPNLLKKRPFKIRYY